MWRAASVVALLAASGAIVQVPLSPTEIIGTQRKAASALAAEWLQSRDAFDLMQLAANYQAVADAASLSEADDHDAMLAVLDALIQMDVDVPVAAAAKMYPEFRAQSMILMILSSSDATADSLRMFWAG